MYSSVELEEYTQNITDNSEEIHLDSMNDEKIKVMNNKLVIKN